MGLYDVVIGRGPNTEAILGVLGRSENDFPRFRDAHIDGERKMIAVYTRMGKNNRECWCGADDDGVVWAAHKSLEMKMRTQNKQVNKEMPGGLVLTEYLPEKETVPAPVCLTPDSKGCACNGCQVTYLVPDYQFFDHMEDDTFDATYTTIYFTFPPEAAEALTVLAEGKWEPEKRWDEALEKLKAENSV